MQQLTSSWNSSIEQGEYLRKGFRFRHWITAEVKAGSSDENGFVAEAGRYHLYATLACPWDMSRTGRSRTCGTHSNPF